MRTPLQGLLCHDAVTAKQLVFLVPAETTSAEHYPNMDQDYYDCIELKQPTCRSTESLSYTTQGGCITSFTCAPKSK
jgi:hypothetical protein